MTAPKPANEIERALVDALSADDRREYFRLLTAAPLYLPLPAGTADGSQSFLTWDLLDRRYLVVYTSLELLVASLQAAAPQYTTTNYAELREKWPNPDWHLAVNPGLPLDCYLPVGSLAEAAEGRLSVPTMIESVQQVVDEDAELRAEAERVQRSYREYVKAREMYPDADEPDSEVELALEIALGEGDVEKYLWALLESVVLLPTAWPVADPGQVTESTFPWRAAGGTETPTIEVFTSERRFVARYAADTPSVAVPFAVVLTCWPDASYALAVNPGSRYELRLDGENLDEVIDLAEDLLIDLDGDTDSDGNASADTVDPDRNAAGDGRH